MRSTWWWARTLVLAAACLAGACSDNVGRVFDRDSWGGTGPLGESLTLPPPGGVIKAARPKVELAAPKGTGWPVTTPVVVLFDEAMNVESLRATPTNDEQPDAPQTHLIVRVKGTGNTAGTPIAGSYTLLLDGRLCVFRPAAPFAPNAEIEVVVGSTCRDIDRQTVIKTGAVAEFTTDGLPEDSFRVVTTLPVERDPLVPRESSAVVVLSAPADPTTVTPASLFLQRAGPTVVPTTLQYPLQAQNLPDTRLIVLNPNATLLGDTRHEVKATDAIKAGTIELDRGGKDPLTSFTTIGPLEVASLSIGNPTQGFPNKVNVANVVNLNVAVEVTSSALIDDKVTVRIYGEEVKGTNTRLTFVEKSVNLTTSGSGTVTVPFVDALGAPGRTRYKDGALTLVAFLVREAEYTGAVLASNAAQDTVAPTLTSVGPPTAPGNNVFATDLNVASLFGRASEQVGGLSLTVGTATVALMAADNGGRFQSQPFLLGRTTAETAFTLSASDTGGNPAAAPLSGSIVQHGLLTGSVGGGSLTVAVYDEATLLPISGAGVLIEPGMPQKPAVGRLSATTGAGGRATFTGLTAASYSITCVASGYDLTSWLDTAAGFASLPLRPARATAALNGTLLFQPSGGSVARAGINVLDDPLLDGFVQTSSTAPTTLSAIPVRANRPPFVSAFAGPMPPAARPTFTSGGSQLGAVSGGRGSMQPAPSVVAPGGSYTVGVTLLPALNSFVNFASAYAFNLTTAAGLDSGDLVGPPDVSILASLNGFHGTVYLGPGFARGSGSSYTVDASYSLNMLIDFGPIVSLAWSSVQARDNPGNLTRLRSWLVDPSAGSILQLAPVAGVPTVLTPAGASTGSPLVTVEDRLSPTTVAGALAFRRLRAEDANRRRWVVYYQDRDAATGTDAVQLPDLAGSGLVGLQTGTWPITAEDWLLLSFGMTGADFNLVELDRLQVTYARARPVDHVVQ